MKTIRCEKPTKNSTPTNPIGMRINYEMRTRNIFRGDIFEWSVSGHGENEFMERMKNKLKIEHLDLRISTTDVICFLFTKKIIPHKCSSLICSSLFEVQFCLALFTKDTHSLQDACLKDIFPYAFAVFGRWSEDKRKNECMDEQAKERSEVWRRE